MQLMMIANDTTYIFKLRREILERFVEEGHNVILVAQNNGFADEYHKMGVKVIHVNTARRGKNPVSDINLFIQYYRILKKYRPDVVFTNHIKPNIYGGLACQFLKIKYITNVCGLGTPVENPGLLQKLTTRMYKVGLKGAKKVFFQNEENRDFMLERGMVKRNYDMLPGSGVNLSKFVVSEYPKNETIDFVFISRIMKEKGIDQYLEMAQYIHEKHPKTRFHVCGSCEQDYAERLKSFQEKGIIIYHGQVDNIENIYQMVSCTVHPTYYPEGLSNVLLESSACARPIITTDRAGCREIIDDGKNGYICKQKDSEDLIRQIEKFLALTWEERRQMGLNGRQKVEKEFDRSIVVEKYLRVMDELEWSVLSVRQS